MFESVTLGNLSEINWSKSLTVQIHQIDDAGDGNKSFSIPLGMKYKWVCSVLIFLINNKCIPL